ncbi:hypothetical protein KR222_007223, partial [Zaprionus bogoriensis]
DTDDEQTNVPTRDGVNASTDLEPLRCIVCKTLPFNELFQCEYGHHMCAGCYHMRVLDKMLGSQLGTCPQCQVRIYRHQPLRNQVAEMRLSTVLVDCVECGKRLQRGFLRPHQLAICPQRIVSCRYKRIGCRWKERASGQGEHEANCEFRHKKASELLETLQQLQVRRDGKRLLLGKLMKLLQLPLITVRLMQLLPQLDGFRVNSWVDIFNFEAFTQRWSLQLKWHTQEDVEEREERMSTLWFQLRLESPDSARGPLGLTYTLVSGSHSDVRFLPNLCEKCDYSRDNLVGPTTLIYESSQQNIDQLLFHRGFFARLLMARI